VYSTVGQRISRLLDRLLIIMQDFGCRQDDPGSGTGESRMGPSSQVGESWGEVGGQPCMLAVRMLSGGKEGHRNRWRQATVLRRRRGGHASSGSFFTCIPGVLIVAWSGRQIGMLPECDSPPRPLAILLFSTERQTRVAGPCKACRRPLGRRRSGNSQRAVMRGDGGRHPSTVGCQAQGSLRSQRRLAASKDDAEHSDGLLQWLSLDR
jgi:hypothetical protein